MTRQEEIHIIERIKKGEHALFDILVHEYSPKILSVVIGITGIKEDAEEVAQDVFVKAFFSINKFRGESSFSTWLFRIAYNMAISSIRKRRGINVPFDSIIFGRADDSLPPGERDPKEESFELLESIIKELDGDDRFLLMLFYNEEKSIKEIHEITGFSESNIKTKLHRIKNRLRERSGKKMEVCYG